MQERKDYYSILGVEKTASKADIRKKFRELSLKYHPDKQGNKSEEEKKIAEDKFKEINEAYSVLSDDKKRAEYDNPQPNFESMGGSSDIDEMMREFMRANGFNMGGYSNYEEKPRPIRVRVDLTLDEVFNGCEKEIEIPLLKECSHCHGSGGETPDSVVTCPHCGGTGTEFHSRGGMQTIMTCRHCGGRGKIIKKPCHVCGGTGKESYSTKINVKIPKGATINSIYNLRGAGSTNKDGKRGDVECVINLINTRNFEINDYDLGMIINISPIDALLGCEKEIETVDYKKLKVKIKPNTLHNSNIRIGGYGLYYPNSSNKRGDLYCLIRYNMPSELNDREKELLKELQNEEHFK